MTFWRNFINLVLPPRCFLCGKVLGDDYGLCDECFSEMNLIRRPLCYECGQPLETALAGKHKLLCGHCLKPHRKIFRMSRSACAYDELSKKLILDFKFYDKTDLASFLAKMMFVAGQDIFEAGVDLIIPVPLHLTRMIERKYNQSALLAVELGKLARVCVETQILTKVRKTKQQVDCSGEERLRNLRGAFALQQGEKLKGKRLLLIDDVLTTGSTLKECAYVLKKAKPKSIDILTIARVL